MSAIIYLLPTVLSHEQTGCLPPYIIEAVKTCNVFFVENERTARRHLKLLWKDMPIDNFTWFTIQDGQVEIRKAFEAEIRAGKTIGIMSEAGCPGVADPGQYLVSIAQSMGAKVRPLVGPNSLLLALMASGMNGQQFQFHGYLPIAQAERVKAVKSLESESKQRGSTHIFIETPYRNNQLFETIVKSCAPATRLCIAVDLTAPTEMITTRAIKDWMGAMPNLHKRPAIFLLQAT